ncbi:MAG: hypothetical protein ACRELA_08630, partial [Candidatus Rokuibacteriota bacterium]
MANVVLGRVRRVDEGERVVVLGHVKFRVAEGVPLADLTVGSKVTGVYEERDGKYWMTQCFAGDFWARAG